MKTGSSSTKPRVAVLISGRGSNMRALIEAAREQDYPATIDLVISNKADAAGLAFAASAGIQTVTLPHSKFGSRLEFDLALDSILKSENITYVCLAGFMRLLTPQFVERWQGQILNIHPSLLPKFPGLHPHQQAIDADEKISGCTVHFVTAQMDSGPIVSQGAVPVYDTDTASTLSDRILSVEHRLYPKSLALLATGQARMPDEQSIVQVLETLGVNLEHRRILDVNTGFGQRAREFARRGAIVTGLDNSEANLAKAKAISTAQGLKIDYIHGGTKQIEHRKLVFDYVFRLCEHNNEVKHARQLKKFLHHSGCLVIAAHTSTPPQSALVHPHSADAEIVTSPMPSLATAASPNWESFVYNTAAQAIDRVVAHPSRGVRGPSLDISTYGLPASESLEHYSGSGVQVSDLVLAMVERSK